jgi:hypothetical protein
MLRSETIDRIRKASILLDHAVASLHADEQHDPHAGDLRDLARDADCLWRETEFKAVNG